MGGEGDQKMIGTVTLFGSGETSTTGGQLFEALLRKLPAPGYISVLETPAGFESNSARVAGRICDFLATRLQNYHPRISQLAARKKGTPHSPDSPQVVAPLLESNLIFLGPGSPTYAVRQLQDSLAWHMLQARHRLGASLVFASAATIAAGSPALPVYEIFKVGEDPHWKPGLDFFAPFGLKLAIIPHWNNQDGGAELDTSRCFIGRERFELLAAQLPEQYTILGLDELTALTFDFETAGCQVAGLGSVHLLRAGQEQVFAAGANFPLHLLGDYRLPASPSAGLPDEIWRQVEQAVIIRPRPVRIPEELQQMVDARELARKQRDWSRADFLRQQIAALGWKVADSPTGPTLTRE